MNELAISLRKASLSLTSQNGYRTEVIKELDLSIQEGERVALVGQNGAGKTSLLRLILGGLVPDSGSVTVGLDPAKDQISYVPQDYRNAFFPWLSLRRNLFLGVSGKYRALQKVVNGSGEIPESIVAQYERISAEFRLSIDLDRSPATLSGGQQQLFLLVRALVTTPRLLVLDEPLSAVDFGRKRTIRAFMGRFLSENRTTSIFASHDFEESVFLADRIIVLGNKGKVLLSLQVDLPWPRILEMQRWPIFVEILEKVIKGVA